MKTESMVTRAARAMFASQQWPEQFHPSFEVEQERFETAARAAIEAIREPTPAMQNAGFRNNAVHGYSHDATKAYRAMIDAALSEEGE